MIISSDTWPCALFQCCTWRGVGGIAGGALKSPSRVRRRPCVITGSAASESSWLLSVRHTDQHTCNSCREISVTLLFSSAGRPKHLLVYINPYGGKQQGKRIYEQKVAPLFALAGIFTHVFGASCITHFLFFGFQYQYSENLKHVGSVLLSQ